MLVLTKVCNVCGSKFQTRSRSPKRERFCSKSCYGKFWNRVVYSAKVKPAKERDCVICGKLFKPANNHPNAETCSLPCNHQRSNSLKKARKSHARDVEPRNCGLCKKSFVPSVFNWKVQKFCSPYCAKIVGSRRFVKKHPGAGTARARRKRYDGNLEKCLERDNGRCHLCKSKKGLHVHHIDGSGRTQEPNHALDNLVTLCSSCHRKIHCILFRLIDGQAYVSGLVFDWLKLKSVKVLSN